MVSVPKVRRTPRQVRRGGSQCELLVDRQVGAAVVNLHGVLQCRVDGRWGARRERPDAPGEIGDDLVERGVLAGAGGVGDGPVQPTWRGVGERELFMGRIADGDDEVGDVGAEDVVDVPRRERSQRDAVAPGRGDGAGVHGGCGVCAADVAGIGLVPFHSAAAS